MARMQVGGGGIPETVGEIGWGLRGMALNATEKHFLKSKYKKAIVTLSRAEQNRIRLVWESHGLN